MRKCLKNMFIFLLMFLMISSVSFANENNNFAGAAGAIQSRGEIILSAIVWLGYAVALGMVVFIGIKYILGAADAKANMKSAIVNWLIGAFMVFMCTSIINWVLSAAGLSSSENGKNEGESGLASSIIEAGK